MRRVKPGLELAPLVYVGGMGLGSAEPSSVQAAVLPEPVYKVQSVTNQQGGRLAELFPVCVRSLAHQAFLVAKTADDKREALLPGGIPLLDARQIGSEPMGQDDKQEVHFYLEWHTATRKFSLAVAVRDSWKSARYSLIPWWRIVAYRPVQRVAA